MEGLGTVSYAKAIWVPCSGAAVFRTERRPPHPAFAL